MEKQSNSDQEKENMRRWVEAWKLAGPELERDRRKQIREADTKRDLKIFRGLASWALKQRPPLPTSGLVEQQRLFALQRR